MPGKHLMRSLEQLLCDKAVEPGNHHAELPFWLRCHCPDVFGSLCSCHAHSLAAVDSAWYTATCNRPKNNLIIIMYCMQALALTIERKLSSPCTSRAGAMLPGWDATLLHPVNETWHRRFSPAIRHGVPSVLAQFRQLCRASPDASNGHSSHGNEPRLTHTHDMAYVTRFWSCLHLVVRLARGFYTVSLFLHFLHFLQPAPL